MQNHYLFLIYQFYQVLSQLNINLLNIFFALVKKDY